MRNRPLLSLIYSLAANTWLQTRNYKHVTRKHVTSFEIHVGLEVLAKDSRWTRKGRMYGCISIIEDNPCSIDSKFQQQPLELETRN